MKLKDFDEFDLSDIPDLSNRLSEICDDDEFSVLMTLLDFREANIETFGQDKEIMLLLEDDRTDMSVSDFFNALSGIDDIDYMKMASGLEGLMSRGFISGYKESKSNLEKYRLEQDVIKRALNGGE